MAKLNPISLRLDADVRAALEERAGEDERSLSAYINRVLRAHAVERGRRPGEDGRPRKPSRRR